MFSSFNSQLPHQVQPLQGCRIRQHANCGVCFVPLTMLAVQKQDNVLALRSTHASLNADYFLKERITMLFL
jgi:hypothetical protein